MGRKLDIDHQHRWASSTSPCSGDLFPSLDREYWDWSNGRYSLISWAPYANLDQILSGQFDSCIRDRARRLAAFQNPILVRIWWEMNLTWPMWSGQQNGANYAATQKFVSAWRYVVDMMRAEGATNVLWVWCPNAGDVPWDTAWNHWTNYYPGDNYVDWVAMDGYNWNSGYWGWDQFVDMFTRTNFGGSGGSSVYNDYAKRKPIMVAETGSAEDPNTPDRKGDWMRNIASDVPTKMPDLKALVYFNVRVSDPSTPDWRVSTSQSSFDGFRALGQSTFFHTR
jgi:beta-mannanase